MHSARSRNGPCHPATALCGCPTAGFPPPFAGKFSQIALCPRPANGCRRKIAGNLRPAEGDHPPIARDFAPTAGDPRPSNSFPPATAGFSFTIASDFAPAESCRPPAAGCQRRTNAQVSSGALHRLGRALPLLSGALQPAGRALTTRSGRSAGRQAQAAPPPSRGNLVLGTVYEPPNLVPRKLSRALHWPVCPRSVDLLSVSLHFAG